MMRPFPVRTSWFSILVLTLTSFGWAQQDIVIFDEDDAIGEGYYDASWGTTSGGSELVLIGPGKDKMPIETLHSYIGAHSGRIQWKSAPGGHWRLFIASDGWVGHNATGYSNLLFFINGPQAIPGENLPKVGLEDTDNQSSSLTDMGNFISQLDGDSLTWQRVVIPLTDFMPYNDFDLDKLKTVRFNQGQADDVPHTLWVDEIRVIYGEVDTVAPAAPTNLIAIGGNRRIYLDWDDNLEPDLQGYNVYRAESSGAPYYRRNSTVILQSQYVDEPVTNGFTYYYCVKAVDISGNESPASNEAWATPQDDQTPPAAPANLVAIAGDGYVTLDWDDNTEIDLRGYFVYRAQERGGPYEQMNTSILEESRYTDYAVVNGQTYFYTVTAVDDSHNESAGSDTVSATPTRLSDDDFLEMVQRAAFDYFWYETNPNTGVIQDRMTNPTLGATGATGFGLTALCIAAERGWVTRALAAERVLTTLNFFLNTAEKYHGMYSHFLNRDTGEIISHSPNDDGIDVVETAYLIAGALTCRKYFDGSDSTETQIRRLATQLYEDAEWDWMLQGNHIIWHWSPNYGYGSLKVSGYNEAMIVYLLAIGSPTHPVPAHTYHDGWAASYKGPVTYYGIKLDVESWSSSLFTYQYTHCWVDFRNKKDAYTDYFINSTNATLINRAYCIANPGGFVGYGENLWGLTACDGPGFGPFQGYAARGPFQFDDGTIAPTAAAGSMPFTPQYSLQTLRYMYDHYKSLLWGVYGFKDAFNLSTEPNWVDEDYIGINQGPIVIMIENYRTGLIWKYFMQNEEITAAMKAVGFQDTGDDVEGNPEGLIPSSFFLGQNFPNPFNESTKIEYGIPSGWSTRHVKMKIYDVSGREVCTLVNQSRKPGRYVVIWDGTDGRGYPLPSGLYFCCFKTEGFTRSRKLLLLR